MASDHDVLKASLDHAWRYFDLHARQRMSVFSFFTGLSGVLYAGLASTLLAAPRVAALGIALGLLLALLALVFWKLDERACSLILAAEQALAALEARSLEEEAQLIRHEPGWAKTESLQGDGSAAGGSPFGNGPPLSKLWTQKRSFGLIFLVMGMVGLGGSLLCALRYFSLIHWQ